MEKKIFLVGSDYVFPRTANEIIKKQAAKIRSRNCWRRIYSMGHTDYTTIINKIKQKT